MMEKVREILGEVCIVCDFLPVCTDSTKKALVGCEKFKVTPVKASYSCDECYLEDICGHRCEECPYFKLGLCEFD